MLDIFRIESYKMYGQDILNKNTKLYILSEKKGITQVLNSPISGNPGAGEKSGN